MLSAAPIRGPSRPEILLVEDNGDEVELMRQACRICELDVRLHRVRNGAECLAYLHSQGSYAGAPLPHLVVLDLNTPVMNGHQVMRAITEDAALRHLPVIVLSSSNRQDDVYSMLKLRCSAYVVKPVEFEEFVDLMRCAGRFWLDAATLPIGGEPGA